LAIFILKTTLLGTNTEKMPRYFSSLLSADAMYSMTPPLSELYSFIADEGTRRVLHTGFLLT